MVKRTDLKVRGNAHPKLIGQSIVRFRQAFATHRYIYPVNKELYIEEVKTEDFPSMLKH